MSAGLMIFAAFSSGFAALLYELSWLRQLVMLFGVNYFAITTILFTFMTGLAVGSLVAGRLVDRWKAPPLLIFIALELFLACYSQLFIPLRGLAEGLYLRLLGDSGLSFAAHTAIRFLVGNVILLLPAMASGATLPVLGKVFVRDDGEIGTGFSLVYGANVAGAAAGCFATTFFFIGLFGYRATAWIGTDANILAVFFAFLLWRLRREPSTSGGGSPALPSPLKEEPSSPSKEETSSPECSTPLKETFSPARSAPLKEEASWKREAPSILAASFAIGFTSLACEILWTRIFSQFGPNPPTYIFALVLECFLVGHGLGAWLVFPLLARRLAPRLLSPSLFGSVQALMGLCILTSVLLLVPRSSVLEPVALLQGLGLVLPGERAWIIVPAVLLPALCSGVLFPLANQLSIGRVADIGRSVGTLSALSTCGGILGSFVTGFWLIKALGILHCLILLGAANVLVASWVVWAHQKRQGVAHRGRPALAALAALSCVLLLFRLLPPWGYLILFPGEKVVAFSEGRNDSTAVIDHPCGSRLMLVCGERLLGGGGDVHAAIQFKRSSTRAAVIGVGTGSVASDALAMEGLREVVTVDIDGELTKLMPFMLGPAFDRFTPPRFRFVEDDGRHYLLTHREPFDLIFNDAAIYAWYLELSTVEFNRLVRSRLTPGGLYLGRLHPCRITDDAFRREVATFISVFPNSAYWMLNSTIGMLIGCKGDTPLDRTRRIDEQGQAGLKYDAAALRALSAGAPLITDDHPLHVQHAFLQKTPFPIFEYTPPDRLPGVRNRLHLEPEPQRW